MKKTLILISAALMMVACGKKDNSNSRVANMSQAGEQPAGQIAYVEYDSIMSQYEYCKEYSAQLQQRSATYQQQLAAKQRALENAAEAFQRKIQSGQYTSQEQAQAEQQKLQKDQEQLQRLSMELEQKFAQEQEAINEALHDSVQNFLKDFNKDGRYSIIMAKVGDNLLYADPKLDLTDQVVKGLNKRYKKK
ncbi:MAG: OmpH family outer membrane protein [Bacteroidaceae bacterium]|nr:OmpH family outer membrane protein [Bacteroidaceae bacterium]